MQRQVSIRQALLSTADSVRQNIFARLGFSRVMWGLMLCIHLPPLYKVWRSALNWRSNELQGIGCAWLTLAVVFFILKLLGVRWLRFQTDRRSIVTAILAVALMHSRSVGVHAHGVVLPGDIPILSTVIFASSLRSIQDVIGNLLVNNHHRGYVSPSTLWGAVVCPQVVCWHPPKLPCCAPRPPPRIR